MCPGEKPFCSLCGPNYIRVSFFFFAFLFSSSFFFFLLRWLAVIFVRKKSTDIRQTLNYSETTHPPVRWGLAGFRPRTAHHAEQLRCGRDETLVPSAQRCFILRILYHIMRSEPRGTCSTNYFVHFHESCAPVSACVCFFFFLRRT